MSRWGHQWAIRGRFAVPETTKGVRANGTNSLVKRAEDGRFELPMGLHPNRISSAAP
jgi:hypothetical protein